MNINELYSQFAVAYKNAKQFAKQNDAHMTRECVISCMTIMLEIYKQSSSVVERAKIYEYIRDFKDISALIYQDGITADVKKWFGLIASAQHKEQKQDNVSPINEIIHDSNDWETEVFAKFRKSVVSIAAKRNDSREMLFGTGFIISKKGYLLTNHHVVYDKKSKGFYSQIMITIQGHDKQVPIEVIQAEINDDVALCKFDTTGIDDILPVKRIKDYSKLLPASRIMIIGNGLSMGLSPFCGVVKFPHDEFGDLVTTAPSNEGDSGGPVFDRHGECVGINKSITKSIVGAFGCVEAHGITNATPMDKIDKLLDKWCKQYKIEL